MLSAIRAFAKSWVAALLIGLLILSFAIFGINDVFRHTIRGDAVVKAGDRTVNSAEFRQVFERYKSGVEQQTGQEIPLDVAVANGLDRQVLNELAAQTAFAEFLRKIGVRPSDKLVVELLHGTPAFFDQVSGRFDRKSYEQRLAENGVTPAQYERNMRDQIAETHLAIGLANGLRTPRAYTALAGIYALESRDVSYFPISPGSVPLPAPPTDAQLLAFMKENAQALTRPEMRILTVARFSPAAIAATLPVDEAELKKRFDFRKDTLSKPEVRTVVQVPARDAATAGRIAQGLAKGEAPAAVAKAVGVDAITYADKPQTAIADRKVAAAAFQMAAGQVASVQGDIGPAVVKVVSVTPGRQATLAEVRPQLEAEIRKDAAAEKVYAQTEAYDTAHQGGANLAEAARKAGAMVITLGPVTKQGHDAHNQPLPLPPKLLENAFSLPAGGESELEELGNGEYFAVRVEKIAPAALPPLAEVKGELGRIWMMREVAKRMEAKADGLAARVRKGEPLQAVAAGLGAKIGHAAGLDRQSAGQNQTLSQDLLGKAFDAKAGEVFVARDNSFGYLVARLDAVRSGEGPTLARLTEETRPQMSQALFRELGEAARRAAVQKLKVHVDEDKARTALGLEPKSKPGKDGPGKDGKAK